MPKKIINMDINVISITISRLGKCCNDIKYLVISNKMCLDDCNVACNIMGTMYVFYCSGCNKIFSTKNL